jgi:hypothetical protein
MTQKMASEAKPHARSTVSYAIRRISSIARHPVDGGLCRRFAPASQTRS